MDLLSESMITSLSSEIPRTLYFYSMTTLEMNRGFYYNVYLFGENDINVLMPTTLLRFTTRVFYENTSLPISRSSALITSQTFLQEGSHSLRTLLSPLSLLRYFCSHIIEAISNVAADEIREILHIDDAVVPSSESQSLEVPLWIVINVTDNIMHATTQDPLRMVPTSEEAIDTLLKKSTVLQTECYCCICLDEFNLNAECYTLSCQHFFHQTCITRWLQTSQTCPICRQPLRTLKD